MIRTAAALLLGLGLGAALAWLMLAAPADRPELSRLPAAEAGTQPARGDRGALRGSAREEELAELRTSLELERAMRARLTEQVRALEAQLAELAAAEVPSAARLGALGAHDTTHGGEAAPPASPAAPGVRQPWFSSEALEELGIAPGEIQRMKERWEQSVMEGLYLADAHNREGEPARGQLGRQQQVIEQALRQELGDASYDATLYATGRKNRIVLLDVLAESPAAEAGLSLGDEVISYDGQRMFGVVPLQRATTEGRPGETVEVIARRGGETMRFFVPRGPLGVRMTMDRRTPQLD